MKRSFFWKLVIGILIFLALLGIFILVFDTRHKGKDIPKPVPMPSQPPAKPQEPSKPSRHSQSRSYAVQFGGNTFQFC